MTSSRPLLVLLWFIHVTIPVLEAQEVKMEPEVTGYLGEEVTLRCQFIPGPEDDIIFQVEWELETPAGEDITIIVSRGESGVLVPDTFLKGRVKIAEQSLIIGDVEMRDAGSYTCSVAAFPSGAFEGTTKLVVKEGLGAEGLGAEGLGAEGLGAEGLGSEGLGAEGLGSEGLGSEGLGAEGLGAEGLGAEGLGAEGLGAEGPHILAKIITAGLFVLIVGTMLATTHFIIRKRYGPVPSD